MKYKILMIDDENVVLQGMRVLLEEAGYEFEGISDPETGIALVRQNVGRYALAILDFHMPGITGASVASELHRYDPGLNIVTYSGDLSHNAFERALESGSSYFLSKGDEPNKVLTVIRRFCAKYEETTRIVTFESAQIQNESLIRSFGMIGVSKHLSDIATTIQKYSQTDDPVLIRGENGTGKERVAQAIYANSKRKNAPFIIINCGALSPELLESELFGHEKGAFTNAVSAKQGLLVAAHTGTVFLDEIGDLRADLQVKLLRFLQQHEVKPVGSNRTIKVDVRIIAATNVNLEKARNEGKFREDLYYRLHVLPIELLPLRERTEDVEPLVAFFAHSHNEHREKPKQFLAQTVKIMTKYDWPGNIRELENEVTRLMLVSTGDFIEPKDLHPKIFVSNEVGDYEQFKIRQENEERKFLIEKLRSAQSVREVARDILNISYSTLQSRIKSLGINLNQPKGGKQNAI